MIDNNLDRRRVETVLVCGIGSLSVVSIILAFAGWIEWFEVGYSGAIAAFALGIYFRFVLPGEESADSGVAVFSGLLVLLCIQIANPTEYPFLGITARGVAAVLALTLVILIWFFGAALRGHRAAIIQRARRAVREIGGF